MIDRRNHIRQEADRFAAVLAATDPTSTVPTCPEWSALDLLKHLTQVHQFWATIIGQRMTSVDQVKQFDQSRPDLPDDVNQLLDLRREATDDLLTALEGRDPTETAWSWFPSDQTVDFTWRMQTHEATMHRVDAELVAQQPISPIAPEVAIEGVSHALDVMFAWAPADADRQVTGTLRLLATDTSASWLVNTTTWSGHAWGKDYTDQPACERASAGEPAASISGPAEGLDLLMWNRADRNLIRDGDKPALDRLRAVLGAGIQ